MENLIIIVVLVIIIGAAAGYVYKAKKSGQKCIGCPDAKICAAKGGCSGCCGCGDTEAK